MKNIFKTILCIASLIVPAYSVFAQEQQYVPDKYHYQNADGTGLVYSKEVQGPNEKGEYTIFLKSFVTGEVEESDIKVPAEIVLVLDVSGSMEWGMSDSDYIAVNKSSWTPRDINSGTDTYGTDLMFRRGKDDYYWIRRERAFSYWGTDYYRVYITIDGVKYYLNENGSLTSDSQQAFACQANDTIYDGSLYIVRDEDHNRLSALKEAVNYFIDEIEKNSQTLGEGKTNKIAIVKFSDGAETVNGFLSSSDTRLKTNVSNLSYGGTTEADKGMDRALTLIKTLYSNTSSSNPTPNEQTNKMVVFFTDGEPTTGSSFEEDVANKAISTSKTIKGYTSFSVTKADGSTITEKVKVYTIGTFAAPSDRINTYMNRLSSNYPNATGMGTGQEGSGGNPLAGYSFNATNKAQLIKAFASISNDIVTPDVAVNSNSTVVDVMSKSFTLPTNANPSNVQVWETETTGYDKTNKQYTFSIDQDDWYNITEKLGSNLVIDKTTNKITVTGWDFGNNACCQKKDGTVIGKQLILEIPIEMGPSAVGGPGVGTNGSGSGITYTDDQGTHTLFFETPNIGLPINLHIRKEGLKKGESAKFKIQRMWDGKATIPDDVVIEANTWQDYTSVFVTRRSTDTETGEKAPLVKIVGLHPGFTYRIIEEDWSWSYGLTKVHGSKYVINPDTQVETTSDIEMSNGSSDNNWEGNTVLSTSINLNPFIFVNAKKAVEVEDGVTSVRHAESIVRNEFSKATSAAQAGASEHSK